MFVKEFNADQNQTYILSRK